MYKPNSSNRNNFSLFGGHVDQIPKSTHGQVKFLAVITFMEMVKQQCRRPCLGNENFPILDRLKRPVNQFPKTFVAKKLTRKAAIVILELRYIFCRTQKLMRKKNYGFICFNFFNSCYCLYPIV